MAINTRRWFSASGLPLLALLFIALVTLSNVLLRGARLDLTDNQLYSVTDGTRKIVGQLDEPVNLYFFFSEKSSQDLASLRIYARRVRELLEELALLSKGKLNVQFIDPVAFSEDEDRAAQFGLQAVPVGATGDTLYFGLAGTNSVDAVEKIGFFDANKETFLEYDIAKLIYTLANPKRRVVALLSGLPISTGFDPATQQVREPWVIVAQADQVFEIRKLEPSLDGIDEAVDVLWVVHPKALPEKARYVIDQFVLRGGKALVFVDPHAELDQGANPNDPQAALFANKASDLPQLLQAWGVNYSPAEVVGDEIYSLQVNGPQGPTRHIGVLGVPPEGFNPDEVVTAGLSDRVNVGYSGFLSQAESATTTFIPLIESSESAGSIKADQIRFITDPAQLRDNFTPRDGRLTIAARVAGPVKSAFGDTAPASAIQENHLSEGEANVVIVADTDLLADRLWVQVQNFFGQRVASAWANNGDFVLNTLDNLTGSGDLISIRGRESFRRPFLRVEALQRDADERFRAKEEQLQARLASTEQRLTELQSSRSDDNTMIMTPEQSAEIESFLDQKVQIRKELRQVRRDLDASIEGLGTRLKVINIVAVPSLLLLAGLAYHLLGRRRGVAR